MKDVIRSCRLRSAAVALLLAGLVALPGPRSTGRSATPAQGTAVPDRSPVDVVLTPDESLLLTANQTANTLSLVEVASGKVLAEVPAGERPSAVTLTPDGKTALVTAAFSGELSVYALDGRTLRERGKLRLGFEPRGVAVSPDGRLAYVALTTAHIVAIVDLEKLQMLDRVAVGRWPRYLALSPDGTRLAVGANGDGGVSVVDTAARKMLFQENFGGINFGMMQASADGKYAYFPWMVYGHNPITRRNIQIGWVLASRIARVRLDEHTRREAIALDPRGQAVSDPHGLALSPNGKWVVCSSSGTHELLVFRHEGLPWMDYGGPGDHIDPNLLKDQERFWRIPVGGRPMAVRYAADGRHVYVANYLDNSVQVVDIPGRKVVRTLSVGGPERPSQARRGEAIFYDARHSLDQWYSCHSCHYEGHVNAQAMDTRNDRTNGTFKTVLTLRNVTKTGPWTWHGWQKDLKDAVRKSITETMLGKEPTAEQVEDVVAFMDTLKSPPSPYRAAGGGLTEAARRGEVVFRGEKAGCARCHSGEYFTDGRVHNVGTGSRGDFYKGYNPPSLLGTYDRVQYLHDGRSRSLEELLRGPHAPEHVTNRGKLTEQELSDLVEYLKSL